MSASSTASYQPLDSEAPAVFRACQRDNYLCVAFITLLFYDRTITLDKEVEWIWTLRWRLPKIVFFLNRYVISSLILLDSILDFIFPLSISFCNFANTYLTLIPVLVLCTVQLLLVVRVCSLYGSGKVVIPTEITVSYIDPFAIQVCHLVFARSSGWCSYQRCSCNKTVPASVL